METIQVGVAIIGVISGLQLLLEKQYKSFAYYSGAIVTGVIFGYLHYFGLSGIEAGLAAGIISAGGYKLVKIV